MLKMFVFLLPLLLGAAPVGDLPTTTATTCPAPAWLQKTGQTSDSFSMQWAPVSDAASYEVWFVREDWTSQVQTTSQTSFTFGQLAAGSYTFYVRAVCPAGASPVIGTSDILEN